MAASLLQNLLSALSNKPLPGVASLDTGQQRRVVLMAVRHAVPDRLPAYRKRMLTAEELDADIRDNAWVIILLFWLLIPLVALEDLLPALRVRKAIEEHWHEWQERPDPDLDRWVLEGELQRLIKALPWRERRAMRGLQKELQQMSRHGDRIREQADKIGQQLLALPADSLAARRAELQIRCDRETDPSVAAALTRQLQAIDGQIEGRRLLEARHRRLLTGLDEELEVLRHLHTRLTVLTTVKTESRQVEADRACEEVRSVVGQLSAVQNAEEELQMVGRR